MSDYDSFGYTQQKRGSKVFWIITGIIAFAAIYFPFFGGNLRYTIGSRVDYILIQVGKYLFIAGLLMFGLGLLYMIISGGGLRGLKPMIIGFLLMAFAGWLVNPGGLGQITHGVPVPKGYH